MRRVEQPEADVLAHGQRVEERVLLERHADVAAQLQQIDFRHLVDALAVDGDGARVGPQQAENQLQDDRLAGAAGAQQHRHAGFRHRKADVAQHDVIVEGERHVLEHHRRHVAVRTHRGGGTRPGLRMAAGHGVRLSTTTTPPLTTTVVFSQFQ